MTEEGIALDINALIDRIVSDIRKKQEQHGKIYHDEPILRPASDMDTYLPPKYAEMKQLAAQSDRYVYANDAAIFYKQAMFMADHEDNCHFHGQFLRYFPTYRSLSDKQLRGYFSWRTKVRRGEVEKTALSYVYIYIYELLHLIGADSAVDAFDKLDAFWKTYRAIDTSVDSYLSRWMTDFYVYYYPDLPIDRLILDDRFDNALAVLRDHDTQEDDALFEALCTLSTYRLENAKFTKDYPHETKRVACGVYRRMCKHHQKRCKNTYFIKLFGHETTSPYVMFQSAVFHDHRRREREVRLTPMLTYRFENGRWICQKGCERAAPSRELGLLLKAVDDQLRLAFSYPSLLKPAECTKLQSSLIQKEIAACRAAFLAAAKPTIAIDVSKLDAIRRTADITRDKLIIEEEPANDEAIEVPAPAPTNDTVLDDNEYGFLKLLLYGGDHAAFLRSKRLMPSVIVDGINEKLYDAFADTVIVFDGDIPVVLDDYADDLKGRIPS